MKDKYRDAIDESVSKYIGEMHTQQISMVSGILGISKDLMKENAYLREKERQEKSEFENRVSKIYEEAKKLGIVDNLMEIFLDKKHPSTTGFSGSSASQDDEEPSDSQSESSEAEGPDYD